MTTKEVVEEAEETLGVELDSEQKQKVVDLIDKIKQEIKRLNYQPGTSKRTIAEE